MHITKKYIDTNQEKELTITPVNRGGHINSSWTEKLGSIAGGLVLGYFGFHKLNIRKLMLSAGSAFFLYRSISNPNETPKASSLDTAESNDVPVSILQSIVINKPREEVYSSWKSLRKLNGVLRHFEEITYIDGHKRYRWEMKLPTGLGQVEWMAEVVGEIENTSISYRTLKSSDLSQYGRIDFKDLPDEQGTEMKVVIDFYPPVGDIGHLAAKALNGYIAGLILEDLLRFKHWMENHSLPKE